MNQDAKQRRGHIDKAAKLSVVRQCELLDIHRSGVYYEPKGETQLILEFMRLMGLSATGPKPNTSKRGKGELHRIYKYLLRNLKAAYPNHVWAMDITYIPVQGGYLNLCVIIDLYSRCVVGWSLSNTMTAGWCRRTL